MLEPEITPQVIASGLRFPEGPAFDPDGHLWCVELQGGSLVRIDAESKELTRIDVGGAPNGIAIDAYGRIWFADAKQCAIRRYDPEDKRCVTVVDQVYREPLNRPNDLAFDAKGNLVFTCPGAWADRPDGYVCCLSPDGSIEQIANELRYPNGLAFIHGGQTLLIAESFGKRIWRGEWSDENCIWSDDVEWAKDLTDIPGPDGMTMGMDGRLYVALHGSKRIVAISADGYIVESIETPGKSPTNVAFDPAGQLGLVIAEAENGQLLSLPGLGLGIPPFSPGAEWAL